MTAKVTQHPEKLPL